MSYKAPIEDTLFIMDAVYDLDKTYQQMPHFEDFNLEFCETVLTEAAKVAEQVFAPLNKVGDEEGCTYNPEEKSVKTATGFKEAYKTFIDAGWSGLSSPTEHGGQGLPTLLGNALDEYFAASNVALSMYSGLTHGSIVSLEKYGSDVLKERYLEKLINGTYTGTMCLTEAHCGTDLGLLKSKATPKPNSTDETYLLNGAKIWITGGEHDLSENIIHLVLAKLPDAPAGSKGISLFVVPKFMPDGSRNSIICTGLEHKMGINGSATCFISMEDAQGWLVGEAHQGLKYMFTMMNSARLMVGMQGLGLGDAARQIALEFCKERRQGRSMMGAEEPNEAADCILVHPDVRRMITQQKVLSEGGRALTYWVGINQDLSEHGPSDEVKEIAEDWVALLTPVVKAFLTDRGSEVCDLAVQCMGGSGFTKDWGVEQFLRDTRIARIYEGTNAIQALDLIGRKLPMKGGAPMRRFIQEVQTYAKARVSEAPEQAAWANELLGAVDTLSKAITWLMQEGLKNRNQAAAAATPFLDLFGYVAMAYIWDRMAKAAQAKLDAGDTRIDFLEGKIKSRNFFYQQYLPKINALLSQIEAGCDVIMDFSVAQL